MLEPHEQWMRAALRLGRRNLGLTSPNPSVACLILKDEAVVGRGVTASGGRPHAETIALEQAGEHARGASVYVTLEPCAHVGATPPCCDALVDAKVARVSVACADPNPAVAGQGIARLRAAGIDVIENLCVDEARRDHAGHIARMVRQRPFVQLKLAQTRNGKLGSTTKRLVITCDAAQDFVHRLRSQADAIAIGSGTALVDDPLLTCRLAGLETRSLRRVVFDRRLRLLLDSRLVQTAQDVPLTIVVGHGARFEEFEEKGAEVLRAGSMDDALKQLSAQGIMRLLVEGGGMLTQSLMSLGLVDELVLLESHHDYDGEDAVTGLSAKDIAALAASHEIVEDGFAGTDRLRRFWRR